jgi:polyphenol oxidase
MKYGLELTTENGLPVLASPKMLRERSILICFTTRVGGVSPQPYDYLNLAYHVGDDQSLVTENRRIIMTGLGLDAARLTTATQVHGINVVDITGDNAGAGAASISEIAADALMTGLANTPIAVMTADCVPVILVDVEQRKISVVHAGWKGIYSLIVPRALAALRGAVQDETKNIHAFIGPAVGPCCYEVDEDRAALFDERFVRRDAGTRKVDLKGIVRNQLNQAGLDDNRITDSGLCTCCRDDLFYSFRRDGICGRQMAVAALL